MPKVKPKKPPRRIGAQGWQEFLTSKHELIYAYRLAQFQDIHRPVHTERGNVAESVYKKWLSGFLPARYGVTSGYIISAGYSDRISPRHYDVIIYDKLEAPILWHENNADRNEGGKVRAVPVEYVLHVSEVKSSLNKQSVEDAAEKLSELIPLHGYDKDRLIYLPVHFGSSVIFFDADENSKRKDFFPLLETVAQMSSFMGGIILESPDHDHNKSIHFTRGITNEPITCQSPEDGTGSYYGMLAAQPHQKIGNFYPFLTLDWSEVGFANFAHGIIARMNHNYDQNEVPSPHGMSYGPFNEDDDFHTLFPIDEFAPKPKVRARRNKAKNS